MQLFIRYWKVSNQSEIVCWEVDDLLYVGLALYLSQRVFHLLVEMLLMFVLDLAAVGLRYAVVDPHEGERPVLSMNTCALFIPRRIFLHQTNCQILPVELPFPLVEGEKSSE